jgi:hypothetical protein
VQAISGYRAGESLLLELVLRDACVGVECDRLQTCTTGGTCTRADYREPSALPPFESGIRDAGMPGADAGDNDPDGGAMDGGSMDAGAVDGGGVDAGAADDGGTPDGTADGAMDANGPDASQDAGPDQCPDDPDKRQPGQCGCGTPDTDGDGDGTADCNEPTFQPVQTYDLGSTPAAVTAGDVTDDGFADVLVADSGSSVHVYTAGSTGTLSSASIVPVGNGPVDVELADMDDDGHVDLVTANQEDGSATVAYGNGDGQFSDAVSPDAKSSPSAVVPVDLDGTDHLDLLVSNRGADNVSVLLHNAASDTLAPHSSSPVTVGAMPGDVATADVNDDSHPDLVTANSSDVSVGLGNGDGSFLDPSTFNGAEGVAMATPDLDGDGLQDLVVANDGTSSVAAALADGNGGFMSTESSLYPDGSTPVSVAGGDIDGDGRADAVVANRGTNNVAILLGNGAGSFFESNIVTKSVGSAPVGVAVADLNGDGGLDIVAVNENSSDLSVLLSE